MLERAPATDPGEDLEEYDDDECGICGDDCVLVPFDHSNHPIDNDVKEIADELRSWCKCVLPNTTVDTEVMFDHTEFTDNGKAGFDIKTPNGYINVEVTGWPDGY